MSFKFSCTIIKKQNKTQKNQTVVSLPTQSFFRATSDFCYLTAIYYLNNYSSVLSSKHSSFQSQCLHFSFKILTLIISHETRVNEMLL